ncbi:hypothetical protein BH11ARM2_BH11ARM2_21900 [soil metagenome]
METLTEYEVREALREWLGPDAVIDINRESPDSRLAGWIVHPGFQGVSALTRRNWLLEGYQGGRSLSKWEGLRKQFGHRATQIGMIFALSPYEYESAFAEEIEAKPAYA